MGNERSSQNFPAANGWELGTTRCRSIVRFHLHRHTNCGASLAHGEGRIFAGHQFHTGSLQTRAATLFPGAGAIEKRIERIIKRRACRCIPRGWRDPSGVMLKCRRWRSGVSQYDPHDAEGQVLCTRYAWTLSCGRTRLSPQRCSPVVTIRHELRTGSRASRSFSADQAHRIDRKCGRRAHLRARSWRTDAHWPRVYGSAGVPTSP